MKLNRHQVLIPILALALALASGCFSSAEFELPDDPMVGKPAIPFVFHNVHKRSFPSDNFNGRTLVLIFIQPGQPYLQELLRKFEALSRDPALAAVKFLVMLPEADPVTESFWIGLKNGLPFGLDYTGVAQRYGMGNLPLVVITDSKGIVRLRLDGYLGEGYLPRMGVTEKILRSLERARTRPPTSEG